MKSKWFTVVTFGSPRVTYPAFRRTLEAARKDAQAAMGSGTCTAARVYECDSARLARTADISAVRNGERIVAHA